MAIRLAKRSGRRRKRDSLPLKIGLRHSNDCERQRLGGLQKQPAPTCKIFSAESPCTRALTASNFVSRDSPEEFEGTSFQKQKVQPFSENIFGNYRPADNRLPERLGSTKAGEGSRAEKT